jgi:hypothetical protein
MTYRGNNDKVATIVAICNTVVKVAIIAGIVKVLSAPSKQKKEIHHE